MAQTWKLGPDFEGLDEIRLPDATPGAYDAVNCRFERGAVEGLEGLAADDWAGTVGSIQAISGIMGPPFVPPPEHPVPTTAVYVYGQADFVGDVEYWPDGVKAATNFKAIGGLACDAVGVWVADVVSQRILRFPYNSKTADVVLGAPNFTGGVYPDPHPNAKEFAPRGIVLDAAGGLYVGDVDRKRVIYFPDAANATEATKVWGKDSLTTYDGLTVSEGELTSIAGLAVGEDGMYVSDYANNRVLFFPMGLDGFPEAEPTRVIGQATLADVSPNRGGAIAANTLYGPSGLCLDADGGLYICDAFNNRVLYVPQGTDAATRVYGQDDDFTTGDGHFPTDPVLGGGKSLLGPNGFGGVWAVSAGVYICDVNGSRVLWYPGTSTEATVVYGQVSLTAFDGYAANAADTLNTPMAVVYGPGGLCIADTPERVLRYAHG